MPQAGGKDAHLGQEWRISVHVVLDDECARLEQPTPIVVVDPNDQDSSRRSLVVESERTLEAIECRSVAGTCELS